MSSMDASISHSLVPSRPAHPDEPALGAHVLACDRARGWGFALRCAGERVHELLGPRLFTTVFAATMVLVLLAACA